VLCSCKSFFFFFFFFFFFLNVPLIHAHPQNTVSGTLPNEPVVSVKSGHVFEKNLIEKYVSTTGRCPVTQQPLSASDLLPLVSATPNHAGSAPPRPVGTADSIPSLLRTLQREWDATDARESFQLKQHLDAGSSGTRSLSLPVRCRLPRHCASRSGARPGSRLAQERCSCWSFQPQQPWQTDNGATDKFYCC
jgi:hypothetical protein